MRLMNRKSDDLEKAILSWIALVVCLLLAAWYIKSLAWISSQPVAISSWHQFKFTSYAIALLVGGIVLFGGIRALPEFGKMRIWLLIMSILIILGPHAWEFLKVDSCLDRGGSWDYIEFRCEK